MTKSGRLEVSFEEFKQEVEERLEKLEKAVAKSAPVKEGGKKSQKSDELLLEAKDGDIVGKEI